MLPDLDAFADMESAVTVIPKGFAPVAEAKVIADYSAPSGSEMAAGASPSAMPDNALRLYVRRDQVPILPEGSTIEGSIDGRPSAIYRVFSVDDQDPQYHGARVSL